MSRPSQPYPNLLVVLHIDHSVLPLASRDFTLEENVNLAIGSSLHLRQEEIRQDEANKTSSTPDVAAFTAEVRLLEIDQQTILFALR